MLNVMSKSVSPIVESEVSDFKSGWCLRRIRKVPDRIVPDEEVFQVVVNPSGLPFESKEFEAPL